MTDPVVQMLALLVELYPHPPMTDARLAAFRAVLSDLSAEECDRAYRVMTTSKRAAFFPSTNELMEAARPAPTSADVAELFDDLEYEVCVKRGNLTTIEAKYGPVAKRALVAAGGLEKLRQGGEARGWMLKEFVEAYVESQDREPIALGPVDDRVKQLTAGIGR